MLAIGKRMPGDKAKKWETQAGRMFFKHRRVSYHLRCIDKCYSTMIGEMRISADGRQPEEGDNSSYAGPLAEVLLFHLDGFFEAERSAHDFILSFLRTASLLNAAPSSMYQFYERVTKKPGIYVSDSPEVVEQLTAFWAKTGQRTKEYRDCLSHYVSLSGPTWQHAVNMKWRSGSWKATLNLPDNPGANSHTGFTFDANLDALAVCAEINVQTERFLKLLMEACVTKWKADAGDDQEMQITLHNVRIGD